MDSGINEINSIEEWNALAHDLAEDGYTIFQSQHDAWETEGYHVKFWASKRPDVDIVTHNIEVQKAISIYNGKMKKAAEE